MVIFIYGHIQDECCNESYEICNLINFYYKLVKNIINFSYKVIKKSYKFAWAFCMWGWTPNINAIVFCLAMKKKNLQWKKNIFNSFHFSGNFIGEFEEDFWSWRIFQSSKLEKNSYWKNFFWIFIVHFSWRNKKKSCKKNVKLKKK